MTSLASSIGNLPAAPARPPSSYSEPAGLAVVIAPDPSKSHRKRCKVTHSVRDVLVCGNSLYVASRAEKAIYSCGADFGTPQPFITGLQDNPEFLIYAAS